MPPVQRTNALRYGGDLLRTLGQILGTPILVVANAKLVGQSARDGTTSRAIWSIFGTGRCYHGFKGGLLCGIALSNMQFINCLNVCVVALHNFTSQPKLVRGEVDGGRDSVSEAGARRDSLGF